MGIGRGIWAGSGGAAPQLLCQSDLSQGWEVGWGSRLTINQSEGRRVLQAEGTAWAKALRLEGGSKGVRECGMKEIIVGEEMSQRGPSRLW